MSKPPRKTPVPPPPGPLAESEVAPLIRRAHAGDRAAQDALLTAYKPQLERAARRRLRTRMLDGKTASDFVQEASEKALRHFGTFKGKSVGELREWLHQILQNAIIAGLRRIRAHKRGGGAPHVPLDDAERARDPLRAPTEASPSQTAARRESWRTLLGALSVLPPRERDAIRDRFLRQLPVRTIAERHGTTELAVASLLQRGLARLARAVTQTPGEATAVPEPAPPGPLTRAVLAYLQHTDLHGHVAIVPFVAQHPAEAPRLAEVLNWLEQVRAELAGDAHTPDAATAPSTTP